MYVCANACVCTRVCACRSEDSLLGVSSLIQHMVRNWTSGHHAW